MGGVTVKTLDYFEECYCFPALGKLTREHIFYQMGLYPILFVCKDGNKNRYLCSCCRLGEEWIINQVSENALVAFIEDKITIREVFEDCDGLRLMVKWDGERFSCTHEIPDDMLPEKGALLELKEEQTGEYRDILMRDIR